jgi:hypothetical protein
LIHIVYPLILVSVKCDMIVILCTSPALAQTPAPEETSPETVPSAPPNDQPSASDPAAPPLDAVPETPEEKIKRLNTLYMEGLQAWEQGKAITALRAAQAVLAEDPSHRQARLLCAYVLAELGRDEEAAEILLNLIREPVNGRYEQSIQDRAESLYHRLTARYRRTNPAFFASLYFPIYRRADALALAGGYAFSFQYPLSSAFHLRTDWQGTLPIEPDNLSLGGMQLGALGMIELPLGSGRFSGDIGLGPSVWYARGAFWPDQSQWYLGGRAELGIDVRLSGFFGFRVETGWSAWPGLSLELEQQSQAMDFKMGMGFWF